MGSNESLPPPVPPGEPPRVPPPPPAVPQFPPTEPLPPTVAVPTDLPPTQAMPPVPSGSPIPPAPPQPGQPFPGTTPPPPDDGRKHLVPWIIGAAVVVVGLVLVAVFALRDDNESSGTGTTVAGTAVTTVAPSVAPSSTVAPTTTVASETSAVITEPSTTSTAPATTLPISAVPVKDDTGTFTVLMLDSFETSTAPVDVDGVPRPSVIGATDLAAFTDDNDHDTFGTHVVVGPTEELGTSEDILANNDPGPDVCTDRTTSADYPTLNGTVQLLLLDGCGTDGAFAKVILTQELADSGLTLIVYTQGPGPSNTDLLDFTQAVAESVVLL